MGNGDICWAKAEHVQAAWQDDQLARDWDANAAMLNRFAEKLRSVFSGEQSKPAGIASTALTITMTRGKSEWLD